MVRGYEYVSYESGTLLGFDTYILRMIGTTWVVPIWYANVSRLRHSSHGLPSFTEGTASLALEDASFRRNGLTINLESEKLKF